MSALFKGFEVVCLDVSPEAVIATITAFKQCHKKMNCNLANRMLAKLLVQLMSLNVRWVTINHG